jgi:hypothetical protein
MHPATVALLAVALVVVVVAVIRRSRSAHRSPIAMEGAETGEPSIYRQIRDQLQRSPDAPLSVEKIRTDDAAAEGHVRFAAGASDALFGRGEGGTEWKAVLDVLRRLGRGKALDWTALDAVTAVTPTARNVDQLIDRLRTSDLTPTVRARFWEVALKSRRTESVKWGLAIGGIGLRPEELEPLLALAHHAEFTLYAAHVLMREGAKEPRYRRKLVELLPRARQWGVIRLVEYIVTIDDLIADVDVQRDVLIYGMENNDGIPMELAFTLAKAVDVHRLLAASRDDDRLRRAFCALMDSLLTEWEPLGGLTDLEGWEKLYDAWVAFLEDREADVKGIGALRSLRLFLSDDLPEWNRKEQERVRIERLWTAKFSAEALRQGLDDERDRWLTLQVIEEQATRELLPDVRQAHTRNPDYSTIRVLAKIGSEEDLEALRASIGRLVDLEARRQIPLRTQNVFGPEHKHSMEYGQIVRAMARLATPDAVTSIKRALVDYDPYVRAAGCDAVANLKSDLIDDEIRTAVRSRLLDAPPYVAESARNAANSHGIRDGS